MALHTHGIATIKPQTKKGGSLGLPPCKDRSPSILEVEADGELQLPHGCTALQGCDFAVVAALAINTAIRSVVLAESVDRMVEDIESIHAELRAQSLENLE